MGFWFLSINMFFHVVIGWVVANDGSFYVCGWHSLGLKKECLFCGNRV